MLHPWKGRKTPRRRILVCHNLAIKRRRNKCLRFSGDAKGGKKESTLLPSVIREIFILDSQKKNIRPAAVRFGRGGQTIRPAANFVSAANAANHQSMLNDQSN